MLVPRSFKYTSPPANSPREKSGPRSTRKPFPRSVQPTEPARIVFPTRTSTEPVSIPSSDTANAPAPARTPSEQAQAMPSRRSATLPIDRRKTSAHDPDALPPAVAALLAVTAIPPRRPNRYRNRPGRDRRISIEELVRDWKRDGSLSTSSYGSSGALSVLLEDIDCIECHALGKDGASETGYLNARTASSESMPSLASDDRSVLSVGSPSTPSSLQSHRSYQNLKKEKSRSLPSVEDCASDHPLVPVSDAESDDEFQLPTEKQNLAASKPRSSFKSNLTTSLHTLKNVAVSSISSLGRSSSATPFSRGAAPPIDDLLWSHPFLFPRFSSETRPAFEGVPTEAQRRYLNPIPLTFEEQEAHFQQALHAPFLMEAVEDAPTIQLQTYNRGRRRGSQRKGSPNPSSEAGRALLGADGVRQREVRENSNFLRVVVLEMNMRREGKLEQGKAKIWLPPRQTSPVLGPHGRVPKRWVGVSAY